jgi:hypothetical protein
MAGWLYRRAVAIVEFGERRRNAAIIRFGLRLRDLVMRLKNTTA